MSLARACDHENAKLRVFAVLYSSELCSDLADFVIFYLVEWFSLTGDMSRVVSHALFAACKYMCVQCEFMTNKAECKHLGLITGIVLNLIGLSVRVPWKRIWNIIPKR